MKSLICVNLSYCLLIWFGLGTIQKSIHTLKGGGGTQKAYENVQGEGALVRKYVCPCNLQMLITCKASYINKIIF